MGCSSDSQRWHTTQADTMVTSRHDVTQQKDDDVTTPKEAVPAHDATECTTSSDVISTPDAAVTEQTCTASGRAVHGQGMFDNADDDDNNI